MHATSGWWYSQNLNFIIYYFMIFFVYNKNEFMNSHNFTKHHSYYSNTIKIVFFSFYFLIFTIVFFSIYMTYL